MMRAVLPICVIAILAFSASAAEKKSSVNEAGRYKIHEVAGQTFLLDSATGVTWRWVWYESDSAECKKKKLASGGNLTADCMVWQWVRATWLLPPP